MVSITEFTLKVKRADFGVNVAKAHGKIILDLLKLSRVRRIKDKQDDGDWNKLDRKIKFIQEAITGGNYLLVTKKIIEDHYRRISVNPEEVSGSSNVLSYQSNINLKSWNTYVTWIKRNCTNSGYEVKDLFYWRNNLFASTITYVLPFCFIALVPGIYWCFVTGKLMLALFDTLLVVAVGVIAFAPGLSVRVRKIIFICCMYILSGALLYYLGLYGPGLLYLQAACIYNILIFQSAYIFWAAWLNTILCLLFGAGRLLNIIPWPPTSEHSFGAWIAVSSNLVFLSFLSAALIPRLFNGLQETLDKEKQLKEALSKQQQSLEQALNLFQQKNNELEQFAYAASHDLKEPLRMVRSFVTLLENKYAGSLDDTARKYIHFAADGSRRMETLINDLLEYSQAGKNDHDVEETEISEIIQEVRQLYSLIIGEKAVTISTNELPSIRASRTAIRQVFQNLIGNAIKYSLGDIDKKPYIFIKGTETTTHWQFSVADNGIGISKDNFQNIFTIFKRLHSKEEYSGTGIGLAICKKIVEQCGGEIWVESEEGNGSCFYFTIIKKNI